MEYVDELLRVLAALHEQQVDYVLIGGAQALSAAFELEDDDAG